MISVDNSFGKSIIIDGNNKIRAKISGSCLKQCHYHQQNSKHSQCCRGTILCQNLLCIIIKIIYNHILNISTAPRYKAICCLFNFKQHLQNRDDDCKREQCQKRSQNIKQNIQREISFVRGHKPPYNFKKFFHTTKLQIILGFQASIYIIILPVVFKTPNRLRSKILIFQTIIMAFYCYFFSITKFIIKFALLYYPNMDY